MLSCEAVALVYVHYALMLSQTDPLDCVMSRSCSSIPTESSISVNTYPSVMDMQQSQTEYVSHLIALAIR